MKTNIKDYHVAIYSNEMLHKAISVLTLNNQEIESVIFEDYKHNNDFLTKIGDKFGLVQCPHENSTEITLNALMEKIISNDYDTSLSVGDWAMADDDGYLFFGKVTEIGKLTVRINDRGFNTLLNPVRRLTLQDLDNIREDILS
ncbi:hypothetical protein ACR79B_20560 [Sphingobacterium spiritivorum]|uniref:hypothetical protein n=1 Tax=Sphingobacterium spiritivorum TaxID=258 RepID=UPI003DA599A1